MNHIRMTTTLGSLDLDAQAEFSREIIVVSGENGSGKTTLLRCLAGLEDCQGQFQIAGDVWLDSAAEFVKPTEQRNIGFVWSDAVLLPWLNAEANIMLGVKDGDAAWFTKVCEALEVNPLLKRKPAMLSTGEAQRVSLARAWYIKPSLLLLDEPFSAQAPDIRLRLRQALKDLQQTLDIPVLMVSHDAEDAKVLAQQHWRMREGKLMVSINRHSREGGNPKEKKVNHE